MLNDGALGQDGLRHGPASRTIPTIRLPLMYGRNVRQVTENRLCPVSPTGGAWPIGRARRNAAGHSAPWQSGRLPENREALQSMSVESFKDKLLEERPPTRAGV